MKCCSKCPKLHFPTEADWKRQYILFGTITQNWRNSVGITLFPFITSIIMTPKWFLLEIQAEPMLQLKEPCAMAAMRLCLFGSEKSPLSTSMSHWLKCIQLFPLCAFALSHPKWRQLPYLTALPAALSKTPILTVMLQATAIFCHTPALQTRGFTP